MSQAGSAPAAEGARAAVPGYLGTLADRAARVSLPALPASTVEAARRVVLDTIGAIIAGSRLEENARLARMLASRAPQGRSTLLGHGLTTDAMWAALANATAGVALEMDEGNRWGGGHPAIHVLPAVLAVAEERQASGAALIEALVAGYEVTSRIGGATQLRPNVHSHGTWGTLGAAAGVARLLGRGGREMRAIVSLAASMTPANSWTPCFEGATIRNLYPGRAAMQGILAVHVHDCGFTGLADGPADVFGSLLAERFDGSRAVDGLEGGGEASPFRIEENYFKFHACCLYNHPALDAVDGILGDAAFRPEDVEAIEVTAIPFAARMTGWYPAGMLDAKFSIPYALAARIVTGRSDPTAFLEPIIADERVRKLAARVTVATDPTMSMQRSDPPQARVRVRLRDGRILRRNTPVIRGDARNPASQVDLEAKFRMLAEPVIGTSTAERVIRHISRLEILPDLRGILVDLREAASVGAASAVVRDPVPTISR